MIITYNEDLLRVKCEKVLPEEVGPLVFTLESELNRSCKLGSQGIGLAASQIGIAKDIAIIRMGKDSKFNINLINAKITKKFDSKIFRNEGCLSFPGRVEDTLRYQEILIENSLEHPNGFIATGLLAVVCQHEIDHLNGSLFMDRAVNKPNLSKLGPNDPCHCGKINPITGKIFKYKKCCGA